MKAANQRDRVEIENVNHPGQVRLADSAKYDAMKQALLTILPQVSPGLTVAELKDDAFR